MTQTKQQFAEVIYETGSKSICQIDDLEQFKKGLTVQHQRAMRGQPGGPVGSNHAAERVKRVLLYDEHPGEYQDHGTVSTKSLKELVDSSAVGDQVSIWDVIQKARLLTGPLTNDPDTGPHDSAYLAKHTSELPLGFLEDASGE